MEIEGNIHFKNRPSPDQHHSTFEFPITLHPERALMPLLLAIANGGDFHASHGRQFCDVQHQTASVCR